MSFRQSKCEAWGRAGRITKWKRACEWAWIRRRFGAAGISPTHTLSLSVGTDSMASQLTQLARKTFALFIAFALCVLPLTAADVDAIKARFRELRADAAEVRIKLTDGAKLSGSILRLEADTFTIAQEKTGQERTFQYAQVTEVKKKGLSRGAKAILIPAVIGGSALLVLCVAPFPIGFLCRKDPS